QYSGSTTGSTFDALSKELTQWRRVPDLSFIQGYHKTPGYISALAASVRQHWDANNRPDVLVMSFHGLPERYLHSGDPYFCHCHATARLLAEALELSDEQWRVSFQSRVGREVWLQPYTDELLVHLAQSGTRRVDVVCPGFAADCLETLEEIAMGEKERFENAGGELLSYIPALNDGAAHIVTLADLVVPRLAVMEHANPQGVGSEMRGRRAKEKGASR
ncbi:MAG: ferrochelatase, partial [Gammaproteobacteria bacterium]